MVPMSTTESESEPGWVVVYRSVDQLETGMAMDRLRGAEIPARVLGTQNAALLGAAAHIFDKRIEVPAERAEDAAQILAFTGELADPVPDELKDED